MTKEFNLNIIISLTLQLTVVLLIFLSGFASAKSSYETDLSSSTNNEAEPISRISIKDTSEEFIIKKPAPIGDKKYDDFLNFLYRHDTLKLAKSQRQRRALATREKRAVIFRWVWLTMSQLEWILSWKYL